MVQFYCMKQLCCVVVGIRILSIHHTRVLWWNERTYCRYFDNTWYKHRLVGDVPFYLKFPPKVIHPPFEKRQLRPISAYYVSTVRTNKNIQLSWIVNPPHAEMRTLPLTPPKGGSKSEFVIFVKMQSNKNWCKVSLCEKFQRQSFSRTILVFNGV